MIRWCKNCRYPTKNKTCKLCNNKTEPLSEEAIPVFMHEKIILSYLLNRDVTSEQVWNLGRNYYLINGERIAVNYSSILNNEREIEKIRENISNYKEEDNEKFSNFVEGNKQHLDEIIMEANQYIKETVSKYENYQPVVSWSGGKDSTVTSDLVRKTTGNNTILHIFGDTTLEFPTTYKYFKEFKKDNMFTPFIATCSDKNFSELCDVFGPPSRVMRWCCSIFKTGPISRSFNDTIGKKILTFYGIRKSESASRSKYLRTVQSPKISRQIVSAPIIEWSDNDVWLYILSEKISFNKAYEYGFRRVGCLYCPNNSMWSEFLSSIYFKEEYKKWKEYLYTFAKGIGKEDYIDYVDTGNWKARQGGYGLDNSMTKLENVECNLYENAQNYFMKKPITKDIIQYMKPLGDMKIIEDKGEYKLIINHLKQGDIILQWNENSSLIKVVINSDKNVSLLYKRIECQLRKYQTCILCSACDSVCPLGAISTLDKYIVSDACIHCGKCISHFNGGCLINKTLYKSKI